MKKQKPSGVSKNEQIRRHLAKGKSVSEIKTLMGMSYQRVRNVYLWMIEHKLLTKQGKPTKLWVAYRHAA